MTKSIWGNIDRVEGREILGWMAAPSNDIVPVVMVDGVPIAKRTLSIKRDDVNKALEIDGRFGFSFEADSLRPGSAITLFARAGLELIPVTQMTFQAHTLETNFYNQLEDAIEIASLPDSVAIVCWDGGHNPIGRAKVLYDIIKTKRPTIIVCYIFDELGGEIWHPLLNSDIKILAIPRRQRHLFETKLKKRKLSFDTVWICKPRLPSFELAALVSHADTKLVLDFDDNEEHFSRSDASKDKVYGTAAINLSNHLTERVQARTAASVTLQHKYDATLVRHARVANDEPEITSESEEEPIKIAFIGTVRPHKNLLEATRATRIYSWQSKRKAALHIFGDIRPSSYADQLAQNGAIVQHNIPMSELTTQLRSMDVILAGFPRLSDDDNEILDYQISSKIGDALSVGKPVLVPEGPSVADLARTAGVYLFNQTNFAERLNSAVTNQANLKLPKPFTLKGAYKSFEIAENKASSCERAGQALSSIMLDASPSAPAETAPNLLLFWKQPDAGLFGRRVDQIARAYKAAFPTHNVRILEVVSGNLDKTINGARSNFLAEDELIANNMELKRTGKLSQNSVQYDQLLLPKDTSVTDIFELFLLERDMTPRNTTVVLFPILEYYEELSRILIKFPTIMDVVDNQLSWARNRALKRGVFEQYYAMSRRSEICIFNSSRNREFFLQNGILEPSMPSLMIENWYMPPENTSAECQLSKAAGTHIVYSGNLGDRIDWDLFNRLASSFEDVVIHIVGAARRSQERLLSLLKHENIIYHGPKTESATLSLLKMMDVAIVPHVVDDVSMYMNPLKIKMYNSIGLPTVAMNVGGISEADGLYVANTHDEFLQLLKGAILADRPTPPLAETPENAIRYIEQIQLLAEKYKD